MRTAASLFSRMVSARLEASFPFIAAVFGLAMVIQAPPLSPPDEIKHFMRSYMISEGRFSPPGRAEGAAVDLPRSLARLGRALPYGDSGRRPKKLERQQLRRLWQQPLAPELRGPVPDVGVHPPLIYAPQAIAIGIGRVFEAPPVALLYLARTSNLLCWILVSTVALRRLPRRRLAMATLFLAPMSVYIAASASSDAATNLVSWFWFATVMGHALGAGARLRRLELAELVLLAVAVGLSKPTYLPLLGAVALIPTNRFRDLRTRIGVCALVLAAGLATCLAWMLHVSGLDTVNPSGGADPAAQLGHMLGDPLGYLEVLRRTVAHQATAQLATFTGIFGYLNVRLPALAYGPFVLFALTVVLLDPADEEGLGLTRRAWILLLTSASWFAIMSAAYLGWNPVGGGIVMGIHGRYFYPLVPFVIFLGPAFRLRVARPWLRGLALATSATFLAITLWTLQTAYYR